MILYFFYFLVQPKITYLNNQTASEFDEKVILTCEASGDPTPDISWSFENRVFTEGQQVLTFFCLFVFIWALPLSNSPLIQICPGFLQTRWISMSFCKSHYAIQTLYQTLLLSLG